VLRRVGKVHGDSLVRAIALRWTRSGKEVEASRNKILQFPVTPRMDYCIVTTILTAISSSLLHRDASPSHITLATPLSSVVFLNIPHTVRVHLSKIRDGTIFAWSEKRMTDSDG